MEEKEVGKKYWEYVTMTVLKDRIKIKFNIKEEADRFVLEMRKILSEEAFDSMEKKEKEKSTNVWMSLKTTTTPEIAKAIDWIVTMLNS